MPWGGAPNDPRAASRGVPRHLPAPNPCQTPDPNRKPSQAPVHDGHGWSPQGWRAERAESLPDTRGLHNAATAPLAASPLPPVPAPWDEPQPSPPPGNPILPTGADGCPNSCLGKRREDALADSDGSPGRPPRGRTPHSQSARNRHRRRSPPRVRTLLPLPTPGRTAATGS